MIFIWPFGMFQCFVYHWLMVVVLFLSVSILFSADGCHVFGLLLVLIDSLCIIG